MVSQKKHVRRKTVAQGSGEIMKKLLSLLLVVVMAVSFAVPSFAHRWDIDLGDDYVDRLSDFSAKLYSLFAENSATKSLSDTPSRLFLQTSPKPNFSASKNRSVS